MKTFGLKSLLIAGLFVAASAFAPASAHAGPSLCNGAPNGILDGNEQCETGACCTVKCELKSAGTVCRPSADGTCDVAETCGELEPAAEAACPADVVSADGTPCDDGLFCTVDEVCTGGTCGGGVPNTCDDENDCTVDTCKENNNSCSHSKVSNGSPCEDGSACTENDTCSRGVCQAGPAKVCVDENACTDDTCNPENGECVFVDNTAPCDDGLFCTSGDACSLGACVGGSANGCDDGNACTVDTCDEETDSCGTSGTVEDGTPCDDGLFCTLDDVCTAGVCAGATPNTCDDGNECTSDSCNEGSDTCKYSPTNNNKPCEVGSFCNVDATCKAGVCAGTPRDCDDANICTDDSCNEETDNCDNLDNSAPCDDGLFCTTGDTCGGGSCSVHTATCNDGNACTTDSCDEEADSCANVNNNDPCEDGLFCTVNDACSDGACVPGPARDCGDDNECTDDSCNDDTDTCDNVDNTDPCDDGLFCTDDDVCSGGTCSGSARDCGDGNECTDDSCNELGDTCENLNNSGSCDDGSFCTAGDTCVDGACVPGTGDTCDDGNVCTDDECDEEADSCSNENNTEDCDDGDVCTLDDVCVDGVCVPGAEDPECVTTTTTTDTTSTTLCPENLCGDYNGNCEITASDALGILQAAVGIHGCPLVVCDYTGDGKVSAIDALAVLRAAVELPSNPMCPA